MEQNRREHLLSLYREFPFDEGQLRVISRAIDKMTEKEVEDYILRVQDSKKALISTSSLIKNLTRAAP